MTKKKLFEKHNYLNKNIKYIKNATIREYDMKNAGLSILKHEELISEEEYNILMNKYEKQERNIIVGKFLGKNEDISIELMKGFQRARQEFFDINNINESDILSIKKDAIFLINCIPDVEQVNEDYLFRLKNEYTSYINIRQKEFYYSIFNDKLDIKGFDKEIIDNQKDYLFKFLKECLKLDADGMNDKLFIKLLEFKNDFLEKKLPKEYYRDISTNSYLFAYRKNNLNFLSMKEIDDNTFRNPFLYLDNNLNFIIELISNLLG